MGKAAKPTAVHNAVPMTDTDKYPKLLDVSGTKQSAGITLRTVPESGKSAEVRERALPLRPEKAIPSKSINAPRRCSSSGSFCSLLLLLFPPRLRRSPMLGKLVAICKRVVEVDCFGDGENASTAL